MAQSELGLCLYHLESRPELGIQYHGSLTGLDLVDFYIGQHNLKVDYAKMSFENESRWLETCKTMGIAKTVWKFCF